MLQQQDSARRLYDEPVNFFAADFLGAPPINKLYGTVEGGVFHFDGTDAVRFRTDVPNGVSRDGVHQGGNAAARAQALAELDGFLSRAFAPATH